MPRLPKIAALLLATLWLPATLHCQLETLGLDTLFACCAGQPAEDTPAANSDCTEDGCQTSESSQFAFAKSRVDLNLLPALGCVCTHCLFSVAPPVPASEISAIRQDEALPLQRTWQFVRRAPDTLKV